MLDRPFGPLPNRPPKRFDFGKWFDCKGHAQGFICVVHTLWTHIDAEPRLWTNRQRFEMSIQLSFSSRGVQQPRGAIRGVPFIGQGCVSWVVGSWLSWLFQNSSFFQWISWNLIGLFWQELVAVSDWSNEVYIKARTMVWPQILPWADRLPGAY